MIIGKLLEVINMHLTVGLSLQSVIILQLQVLYKYLICALGIRTRFDLVSVCFMSLPILCLSNKL